jgi:hypothetical protein
MADNLPPRNLEASTSWIPKGLSRPVMGLLLCPVGVALFHVDRLVDRRTDKTGLIVIFAARFTNLPT